jgi:cyanophycin synthetase
VLAAHRAAGERTVFVRDANVMLGAGAEETALLELAALKPDTAAHIDSVLAAVAAVWALDVPPEMIEAGLRTFEAHPKKTHY